MPREPQWRTGVWHGDLPLHLEFPAEWDVTFLWPNTPPPLTDGQIAAILERPVGHEPIRELCRGKKRPLVVVDDPNRPTPVHHVMPGVLKQFEDGGIAAGQVTILVATGTHGAAQTETITKKVGQQAASSCRILVHDSTASEALVKIGKTSFGTPVYVNREVMQSDFVVGIGGVYPNHTAGFGGGSKLALGVLGFDSIKHLHYRHQSLGWGAAEMDATFRQDVDEIAKMIALNTMTSMQVDAERQIVRMVYGNPARYFGDEVAFSRQAFQAPMPGDADMVLCNAYPNDLSLTFALMKGTAPLYHCRPGASRVMVAFCGEGVGRHGLFPLQRPRFYRQRHIARRMRMMSFGDLARKVSARVHRGVGRGQAASSPAAQNPIWVYRPGNQEEALPAQVREARTTSLWSDVVEAVRREQPAGRRLKVLVYPCAPLQCLAGPESAVMTPLSVRTLNKKSA
jgi:nickel-dependent lactate racemase